MAWIPEQETVVDALVDNNCIIIARITTVEIYAFPSKIDQSTQIEPIGIYRWRSSVAHISFFRMKGVRDQVVPIRLAIRFIYDIHVSWEFGSLVVANWTAQINHLIHCFILNTNDGFVRVTPRANIIFLMSSPLVIPRKLPRTFCLGIWLKWQLALVGRSST